MKYVVAICSFVMMFGAIACDSDSGSSGDTVTTGDTTDVQEQQGDVTGNQGVACTSAQDCEGGLVCMGDADGNLACTECTSDDSGAACKVQYGAEYVCSKGSCQVEQAVECSPACEDGYTCDEDTMQCVESCSNSQDCALVGQLCLSSMCKGDCNDYMTSDPAAADTKCDYDFRELTNSDWVCGSEGLCVPEDGSPVCGDTKIEGDEQCESASDCASGELCMDCTCVEDKNDCQTDYDCTAGLICEKGGDDYNHCEQCEGSPRCQEQYGEGSECTGNFVDPGECTITCTDSDGCDAHEDCDQYCNFATCTCDS